LTERLILEFDRAYYQQVAEEALNPPARELSLG
jgi:hypothetical protein